MISTVTTGILASLLSLTSAGPSLRVDPGPDCWYDGYYCSNTNGVASVPLPVAVDATYEDKIKACNTLCFDQAAAVQDPDKPCLAFTLRKQRGQDQCYLLTAGCEQDNTDMCLGNDEPCTSGPADCPNYIPAEATCPALTPLDGDYLNWNCNLGSKQMNPYTDVLPVGTICTQTCKSWKSEADKEQSELESTCELDVGTNKAGWSVTVTHDGQPIVDFPKPVAGYPKPDAKAEPDTDDITGAWKCNCVPLNLNWPYDDTGLSGTYYDPNDELAADFICKEDLVEKTPGNADWTIKGDNSCTLYCDQHYVATAACVDGVWTGNPEWGFWCYEAPA